MQKLIRIQFISVKDFFKNLYKLCFWYRKVLKTHMSVTFFEKRVSFKRQRSWITTASCIKSSNVKNCLNKEKDSNDTVLPLSDDERYLHGYCKSLSFLKKFTTNCLKSPSIVDHATPVNMSSQICIQLPEKSPKLFRNNDKVRPNSCKTFSTLELQSMGIPDKSVERSSSYFAYLKSEKVDPNGWCLKDKKIKVKQVVKNSASSSLKGSNPNLTSPKSESNLIGSFNGFQPHSSLPQDQAAKRSQKNAFPQKIEEKLSNVENVNKNLPVESSKKSLISSEHALKPIACDTIAEAIRSDHTKAMTLVDCRTFVVYNNNHILGALNVSCSDCITRKRLLCGRIQVVDLVSGHDDAKMRFKKSLLDENIKLILYDEDAKDTSTLPKTHPLKVISASLCKIKQKVYYLRGGVKEFYRLYSSLCVQATKIPQFDSIIYSPTTPIVEENIDSAAISEILPFLYIGNERDSVNGDLLKKCNITHVINVTSHLPMPLPHIKYKRLPASDSSCQNLKQYFPDAIQFIDEAKESNGTVLIHCQAGVSRSATIAMAYIMSRRTMSMMQAFKMVKKCRPIIAPNFNFLGQLLELETRLGISDSDHVDGCKELEDKMKDLLFSNGVQDQAPKLMLS